jgi:hypothetical protein
MHNVTQGSVFVVVVLSSSSIGGGGPLRRRRTACRAQGYDPMDARRDAAAAIQAPPLARLDVTDAKCSQHTLMHIGRESLFSATK